MGQYPWENPLLVRAAFGEPGRGVSRGQFLRLAAALAATPTVLAACGGDDEQDAAGLGPGTDFTGRLNVLTGSHMAPIKELAKTYKTKHGVAPRLEEVTTPDLQSKVRTALLARKSPWDSIFLTAEFVSEPASRDWLVEADSFLEEKVRPTGKLMERGLGAATYEGKAWAVPWTLGAPILHWNKGLFEQADLDPEAPSQWHTQKNSWDDFVEAAKKLTGSKNGKQTYGYTDAWAGTHVLYTWGSLLQMHGGRFLDDDLEPVMNSDAGVAATQQLFDLLHVHKVVDPAVLTYTWVFDASPGYLAGDRGMFITWPFISGLANTPEQSKIAGKSGFAPNPSIDTSASVDGSEYFAVPVVAENEDEGWRFLELVTSLEGQRTIARGGWGSIYSEVLEEPDILEKFPFYSAIRQSYDYPVDGGWSPDAGTWKKILSDELHAVFGKKKSPKEALDNAVKKIKDSRTG